MWLSIAKVLISLAAYIARYAADRQLLSAGSSEQEKKQLQKVLDNVRKAQLALDVLNDDTRKRLQERYYNK